MRRLDRPAAVPGTLTRLRASADAAVTAQVLDGVRRISWRDHVFGAPDVRSALELFHDGKCAYCETELKPAMSGEVEHLRPKAAYVDET